MFLLGARIAEHGRVCVGGWVADAGGFAEHAGAAAVPEAQEEGRGCGQDHVAGRIFSKAGLFTWG